MTPRPVVVFDPAIRSGRPTLRGISTEVIADHFWLGDDVEDGFGLSRHELLVVLWFEGLHGQPRFRRRWRVWAESAGLALHRVDSLNAGAVELPEVRGH